MTAVTLKKQKEVMVLKKIYMVDRPLTHRVMGGLAYNVVAFWTLPFLLLLLLAGSYRTVATDAGVEILYHLINCAVAVSILWRYMRDSYINVIACAEEIWAVVWRSALVIFAVAGVIFYACKFFLGDLANLGAYGMLPLFEVDLFVQSAIILEQYPILGALTAVLVGPVTVSCLYYACVFAPIASERPVLAYFAMAGFLAIPRICNALTFWQPEEELLLYLVQLPIHLLACRAYQKADTVWAPIALLALVNTVATVALLILFALT